MLKHPKRYICILLCLVMIITVPLPAAVSAEEWSVDVDGYYPDASAQIPVTGLSIDEVDAPIPGMMLDDRAVVRTKEDVAWEIPVLWFDDTLAIVSEAQEGRSYIPVPAFFLPQGFFVADTYAWGGFGIKLSEALVMLFGGNEIISVYQAETGITYIIPAFLRAFFAPSQEYFSEADDPYGSGSLAETAVAVQAEQQTVPGNGETSGDPNVGASSLIDIYCAHTARDAMSDEDLEYLTDLVINRLQPQAVNLLLDKFPAFREAADSGQIGREIGLYIYYKAGDKDGCPAHENTLENAMAYLDASPYTHETEHGLSYFIGVNTETLAVRDIYDNPVMNELTGKFVLVRDDKDIDDFENVLLHEMFHAFMEDYNRTGMTGFNHEFYPDQLPLTDEDLNKMNTLLYPSWFVEGTAACVENTYQSKRDELDDLLNEAGATLDDRNTSGYLAVLYLSELAARQSVGTSFSLNDDGSFSFSSEKIREGLNSILSEIHEGMTLDQVIEYITPKDGNGTNVYSGTDDFENKFISGLETNGLDADFGDPGSLEFTANFLTYMQNLSQEPDRSKPANGSILFDFEEDFSSPLDSSRVDTSDFYEIVESNNYVESTVPNEVALSSGGKSDLNAFEVQEETLSEGILSEAQQEDAQQESVPAKAEGES